MIDLYSVIKRFAETPIEELMEDSLFMDRNGCPTVIYKQPVCDLTVTIDALGDHCLRVFAGIDDAPIITAQGNDQDNETAILASDDIMPMAPAVVNNSVELIMAFINRAEGK